MIDTTSEALVTLPQAARLIPPGRNGRKTHISTVLRWVMRGSPAPDGQRVRLEALRVGGRWMTTAEALQRFFVSLTPILEDQAEPTPAPRTPSQRERSHARADRRVTAVGI